MTPATLRAWLHAGTVVLLLPALQLAQPGLWFTGVAALACALDAARRRFPAFGRPLERLVPVFRPVESRQVSGAAWLMVGYALAGWMPGRAAIGGILASGLLDPAAALVGRRLGGGRPKSWAGTGAAMVVAAMALWLAGCTPPQVILGAAVGVAVERWSGPFNDNLVVAPAVGLALWALEVL